MACTQTHFFIATGTALPMHATPETLQQMQSDLGCGPLVDADRQTVAELVTALLAEMQAMRDFDVGETEPAITYQPGEVRP